MTALTTPFRGGRVDRKAFRRLIELQIEGGTDVLVPCGTTGESPTLSHAEHEQVVAWAVEDASGRVPVLAGTGSNSTEEALRLTRHAKQAGAAGALVVVPYYNRPSQAGLEAHFRRIADEVPLPIVIYNIPGRTGVNLATDTLARLAEHENIVGVKEASGDLKQITDVVKSCGSDFAVISGDDVLTLPIMSVGGTGVISVTSNVAPKAVHDLVHAALRGDFEEARDRHLALWRLHAAMFLEGNPVPVKAAQGLMGLASAEVRPPLAPLKPENLKKLRETLRSYGLLGRRPR